MESADSYTPNVCFFCKENKSKYCCPRCQEQYCSLECYRSEKHLQCSESFYRECVTSEMSGLHADIESKQKMTEILSKLHSGHLEISHDESVDDEEEELDSDDEEYAALHHRMGNINLDDAEAVWGALTDDEKNHFEALVSAGNVTELVPLWQPWWSYSEEIKLVTELKENKQLEDALKLCPQVIDVPELSSVSKTKPADCVKYNIVNVLASYAFLMRYFNGEADSSEFVAYFLSICHSLGKNNNFEDEQVAVASVEQECINSQIIETDKTSLEVMKHDLYLLLRGPTKQNQLHYCKCALSDLHNIFTKTRVVLKKDSVKKKTMNDFTKRFPSHSSDHLPEIDAGKIKNNVKKVEYYLSYLKSYGLPLVLE